MRSAVSISSLPASLPLVANDMVEFHAARLLLLLRICGTARRIDGLTKLAKLDFFVRYPAFFQQVTDPTRDVSSRGDHGMIRYRYGPWDPRYYQVLPFLEARELITVQARGRALTFRLTSQGDEVATALLAEPQNSDVADHMRAVKQTLGKKSGTALKDLVYATFAREIAALPLGTDIR